jgi:hypothetical protein
VILREAAAGSRTTTAPGRRLRTLVLGLILVGLLGLGATPAWAGLQKEFSVFKFCPYENPEVSTCVYSTTTSGEFHLGSKTVPVEPKVVVLQGGLTKGGTELVPATNGETLSKTALTIPGGLTGIGIGGAEEVTATAELVGPVYVNVPNEATGEGEAVGMPMRVKLDNVTLGAECFVGSASEPVSLHLTTGTTSPPGPNGPITGDPGTLQILGNGKIGAVVGSSLVDNAFAAPGAQGCAGGLGNALVNADSGLPAAAGTNAARLNGAFYTASTGVTKHMLALPEIGRCVKMPAEKVEKMTVYHGLYNDAGCTYEVPQKLGKFEWVPGTGAGKKFSGEAKASSLETKAKTKIACLEASSSGEYTGPKTATISGKFTGCQLVPSKEQCTTAGSAPGEIKINSLNGELGFIKDEPIVEGLNLSIGWLFKNGGSVLTAQCGPSKIAVNVTGSVIGSIPTNKMLNSYSVKFAQKTGKQSPESFEEEPKNTLSMVFGAVPAEQTGLMSTVKINNEEKLEIKSKLE